MFYRLQYEVELTFNDAIFRVDPTRGFGGRKSHVPASFVGSVVREFKVQADNFAHAEELLDEHVQGFVWGVRSLEGKCFEVQMRVLGAEVLVGNQWCDVRCVCSKCLNGIPHEHDEGLNTSMRITGVADVPLIAIPA